MDSRNIKISLIVFFIVGGFGKYLWAYDVVNRYTLLEDKFKTEDMLRPVGHDWLLDITAAANKNLKDIIDDVDEVKKKNTSTEKVTAAQDMLVRYKNTEQTARAQVKIGIPLPSFSFGDVKLSPDLHASANWGANMGIRSETLTADTAFELMDTTSMTPEIRAAVKQSFATYTPGGAILSDSLCNSLTEPSKTACLNYPDRDKYRWPNIPDVPNIFAFTKLDFKGGLLFNYTIDNWFGYLDLYELHRTDYYLRLNADSIAHGRNIFANARTLNSQLYLDLDYKLGFNYQRYTFFGVVEEVKLATLKERKPNSPVPRYGTDRLYRLQGQAKFQFPIVSFLPFIGVHKRSAYTLDRGFYLGGDIAATTWNDRLGLQFRTMIDREHLTLSPRIRLWLIQLEYSLKKPLVTEIDDVKVSTLHSVDIRIFI
ncbi:MAG: hypothetical protein WCG27_04240 [Pseudomonadota bacterium]